MIDYKAVALELFSAIGNQSQDERRQQADIREIEEALKSVAEQAREEARREDAGAEGATSNTGLLFDYAAANQPYPIEQSNWERVNEEHITSNAEMELAECRSQHAALLEFYRAMKALRPWTPFGSEKRLNEAYKRVREMGL